MPIVAPAPNQGADPVLLETDPIDLKLDTNGDLFVGPDGCEFTMGLAGVAQALQVQLRLILGEWFLNIDLGVPWYQRVGQQGILGGKYDEKFFTAAIVTEALTCPGVVSILSAVPSYVSETRIAMMSLSAMTLFGATDVITVEVPS